ncbi:MAG: hypothetical protein ACRD0A_13230 [Acidimicrobiales bacterium]
MAFVLKLTEEETEQLRLQADREHRSMHEVARLAVLDRIDQANQDLVREYFIDTDVPRWKNLLQRLAEA